jgi:S-adenosylmethionine-dependent methyltransferase
MSFEPAVGAWIEGLGRLRAVVRQEVLAAQLRDLAPQPLRVLDVGCGQGTQALALARAGHAVTGVDPSAELLGRFAGALEREDPAVRARVRLVEGTGEAAPLGGPYDLVLCHGVLMYLDDPAPLLAALTAAAGPQARLSLLVRNGLAMAMRGGLLGDWAAATAAFGTRRYVNRLGLPALAHTPDDCDALVVPLGWRPEQWFGVRVFTDHRDEPAPPAADMVGLLAAERAAGAREPYRRVAALLHLVYAR